MSRQFTSDRSSFRLSIRPEYPHVPPDRLQGLVALYVLSFTPKKLRPYRMPSMFFSRCAIVCTGHMTGLRMTPRSKAWSSSPSAELEHVPVFQKRALAPSSRVSGFAVPRQLEQASPALRSGPPMVPLARMSPARTLQPLEVWCTNCWRMSQ